MFVSFSYVLDMEMSLEEVLLLSGQTGKVGISGLPLVTDEAGKAKF